jgi:hypothetical protein
MFEPDFGEEKLMSRIAVRLRLSRAQLFVVVDSYVHNYRRVVPYTSTVGLWLTQAGNEE